MDVFCYDLNEKVNTIINIPQKPIDPLTGQEVIDFNNAKECFICNKEFTDAGKNAGTMIITPVTTEELHIIHAI